MKTNIKKVQELNDKLALANKRLTEQHVYYENFIKHLTDYKSTKNTIELCMYYEHKIEEMYNSIFNEIGNITTLVSNLRSDIQLRKQYEG